MTIGWIESLATGNEAIDNQHKELFRRFDVLLTACNQSKGKDEVAGLLMFLGEYVRTHFAMEEVLQLESDYPRYREHKAQHESFIGDLQKLETQFFNEGVSLSLVIKTNQTMVNWLIGHINASDRDLAVYLHKGG